MTDVAKLEARGFRAWPAPRDIVCGRWAIKLGGGFGKRVNSVNALVAAPENAAEFRAVVAQAESVYAAEGQPALFRVTPLAGAHADPALADAGYVAFDPCAVMTAPLPATEAVATVRIARAPEPDWLDAIAAATDVAQPKRAIHDSIVRAIASPAAFATVFDEGAAAGYGIAVCDDGAVGLFDIVVCESQRGRGLGRALTGALMAWGREAGAASAYLQVENANRAARALYANLGFRDAYPYHYRRKPLTSAPARRR